MTQPPESPPNTPNEPSPPATLDYEWGSKAFREVYEVLAQSSNIVLVDEKLENAVPVFRVKASRTSGELKPVRDRAEGLGYSLIITPSEEGGATIRVVKRFMPAKANVKWNVAFFLATLATVVFAGYVTGSGNPVVDAALYAIPLFAILLTHEFSHYVLSRRHGIAATLPYFIPSIPPIGTFGAVIRAREPFKDRNQLFDIGLSGPLGGFLVAAAATVIGVATSQRVPLSSVTAAQALPFTPLLMAIAIQFSVPAGYALNLNPVGFAAWVGLIVTFLNAIPTAQLDGGHVMRSLVDSRRHMVISSSLAFTMLLISLLYIHAFLIMALLMVFLSSAGHPGSLDDYTEVTKTRKMLLVVWLAMVVLSFPV